MPLIIVLPFASMLEQCHRSCSFIHVLCNHMRKVKASSYFIMHSFLMCYILNHITNVKSSSCILLWTTLRRWNLLRVLQHRSCYEIGISLIFSHRKSLCSYHGTAHLGIHIDTYIQFMFFIQVRILLQSMVHNILPVHPLTWSTYITWHNHCQGTSHRHVHAPRYILHILICPSGKQAFGSSENGLKTPWPSKQNHKSWDIAIIRL